MKRTSAYLKTGPHTLFITTTSPHATPLGRIILVHGYAEHHGRYQHAIDAWVALGFEVIGFDLPGFGRSSGERMVVHALDDLVPIIDTIRDWARSGQPLQHVVPPPDPPAQPLSHPVTPPTSTVELDSPLGAPSDGIPEWLVGHSMGGALVMHYLQGDHAPVAGAILSAPALWVRPYTQFWAKVGVGLLDMVMRLVCPSARLVPYNHTHISRDPEVWERFAGDPFCDTGPVPLATARTLLANRFVVPAGEVVFMAPVIVMHGDKDKMADVRGSQACEGRPGVDQVHVYEGLHHELLQEPERAQVLHDMNVWLLEQHARLHAPDQEDSGGQA